MRVYRGGGEGGACEFRGATRAGVGIEGFTACGFYVQSVAGLLRFRSWAVQWIQGSAVQERTEACDKLKQPRCLLWLQGWRLMAINLKLNSKNLNTRTRFQPQTLNPRTFKP